MKDNMVYLDNAATTMPKFFAVRGDNLWGNANTPYAINERQTLKKCRLRLHELLGTGGKGKFIFTRCATESVELLGRLWDGSIYTDAKEHDSVWNVAQKSPLSLESFRFWQRVNQMTGDVFENPCFMPKRADDSCPDEYDFNGCDLTAAIGKVDCSQKKLKYDACWFSGHKFHGPHIGVLWLCDELCKKFELSDDPNNNHGILHGTPDVAGISAMVSAFEWAQDITGNREATYKGFVDYFLKEVIKVTDDCAFVLGGHGEDKTDAINAVYLSGINADALQQYLSTKNVYVGSGASACSAQHDYRVLCDGYGYSKETAEETIRISFSRYTKKSDIDALVSGISDFYKNFCKTY